MAEALDPALPPEVDRLAQAVLRRVCEAGLMLATAESCTGGLVTSLLTDAPDLSHAFERGFVTYTHAAKRELLGVASAILDDEGAVSRACAVAMAEGALRHSKADLAVSVTGFTESGPDQPAGLVHLACAAKRQPTTHRMLQLGDVGRAKVRIGAVEAALGLLMDQLMAREAQARARPGEDYRSSSTA